MHDSRPILQSLQTSHTLTTLGPHDFEALSLDEFVAPDVDPKRKGNRNERKTCVIVPDSESSDVRIRGPHWPDIQCIKGDICPFHCK